MCDPDGVKVCIVVVWVIWFLLLCSNGGGKERLFIRGEDSGGLFPARSLGRRVGVPRAQGRHLNSLDGCE